MTAGGLTTWTRVEPHARTTDIDVGLAAEVADPLWLIGRQLQVGELDGDDGGTPIAVDYQTSWSRFSRWRPEGTTVDAAGNEVPVAAGSLPLAAGAPVEALVEHEAQLSPDGAWGPRVRAGRALRRLLVGDAELVPVVDWLAANATLDASVTNRIAGELDERYAALLGGRAIDGGKVIELVGKTGQLPLPGAATAGLSPAAASTLGDRLKTWAADAEERWGIDVVGGSHPPAWVHSRLEYRFSLGAPPIPSDPGRGEINLLAAEYDGSGVDWYTFDIPDQPVGLDAATGVVDTATVAATVLPAPLTFPGAPADRFWQFEDSAVSLGATNAGPTDLALIITTEFAVVFSTDWLLVPVQLPVGCAAIIDWVVVRDTFGVATVVGTADLERADGAGRQFEPAGEKVEGDNPVLLVLPSSVGQQRSPNREYVAIQRDEVANLAWIVEHTIVGPAGRGVDRQWAADELTLAAPSVTDDYERVWRLSTPVPSTWFPMVATQDAGGRWLRRARLLDTAADELRSPSSRLFADLKLVRDDEVTRTGLRVTTVDQVARGFDGSSHAWRGREKRPGRGEASSNLRFDDSTPKQQG